MNLSDLIKSLTADEVKATILSILESLDFPVASWAKGAIIRTIIAAFSKVVSTFTELQVLVAKSGFLDYAEGDWLTLLAEQVYNVTRNPATQATGFLTLNNSAGGDYPYAAQALRFYNPATGKLYRNTGAFHLHPLETGLVIPIEAVELGADSTSAAGTITALETTLIGVTCSNAAEVVGFNAESDPDLRLRCRLKLGSLSPNGAADAYDFVARSTDLNGGVTVTRTRPVLDSDTGQATLYIAGPSGAIGAPDVALVQDAVDRICTPLGFDCTVVSASNLVLNVTQTVYVYTSLGLTNAEVQAAVQAQLTAWIPTIPVGGYRPTGTGVVDLDKIKAEILATKTDAGTDLGIFRILASIPNINTPVDESEVVVPGAIFISVIQVAP